MKRKPAKKTAPLSPPPRKSIPVSFSMQPEQLEALKALSVESRMSRSALFQLAIARLLRDGV